MVPRADSGHAAKGAPLPAINAQPRERASSARPPLTDEEWLDQFQKDGRALAEEDLNAEPPAW